MNSLTAPHVAFPYGIGHVSVMGVPAQVDSGIVLAVIVTVTRLIPEGRGPTKASKTNSCK